MLNKVKRNYNQNEKPKLAHFFLLFYGLTFEIPIPADSEICRLNTNDM